MNTEVKVNESSTWIVLEKERLSACANLPGLKKIYVTVLDENGEPEAKVKVRFDVEPSEGLAYDHPNVWGVTDENGCMAWTHLGVPTRYMMWMEDEELPLLENIRTDLGNEYCRDPGRRLGGWRPVNRPGVYSYRIKVQRAPCLQ